MNITIIDVREPNEYADDHVEGALNIPLGEISTQSQIISTLDKDAKIIVYCRSGARANEALLKLKSFGFSDVKNEVSKDNVEHFLELSSSNE